MDNKKYSMEHHTSELKSILKRIFVVLIITSTIGVVFSWNIIHYFVDAYGLDKSAINVVLHTPFESIYVYITAGLSIGFMLTIPVMLFYAYRFIKPALDDRQLSIVKKVIPISASLFVSGLAFGYLFITNVAMWFFKTLSAGTGLLVLWSVNDMLTFIFTIPIITGLAFQMPILLTGLVMAGVIGIDVLKRSRLQVLLAVLVISALLTPPDVVTQIILACPLMLFYESTIRICGMFNLGGKSICSLQDPGKLLS